MNDATLSRIAAALERIADSLESLDSSANDSGITVSLRELWDTTSDDGTGNRNGCALRVAVVQGP